MRQLLLVEEAAEQGLGYWGGGEAPEIPAKYVSPPVSIDCALIPAYLGPGGGRGPIMAGPPLMEDLGDPLGERKWSCGWRVSLLPAEGVT